MHYKIRQYFLQFNLIRYFYETIFSTKMFRARMTYINFHSTTSFAKPIYFLFLIQFLPGIMYNPCCIYFSLQGNKLQTFVFSHTRQIIIKLFYSRLSLIKLGLLFMRLFRLPWKHANIEERDLIFVVKLQSAHATFQ